MGVSTQLSEKSAIGAGRAGILSREFWSRQLRQWHWISSAVCLVLMLMFAVTGVTLNHAEIFEGKGQSTMREFPLSADLAADLGKVAAGVPVPPAAAAGLRQRTGVDISAEKAVDSQYGEIIFDLAKPGRDALLTIDLNAGKIFYEENDRGLVALFNDLHTGRHAGLGWRLLIDLGALFFVVFALTGFGLILLHARMRPTSWPLTSLGLIAPIVIYLILVH